MLLSLLAIFVSCLVIWRSSHGFEVASDYLGRKLPPGIKGATLNAIASSMPEFLTTMFFLFWLRDAEGFSGGLGVTSGSALFNLLIIPALVVFMLFMMGKGKGIRLNRGVLLREGLVLLLSQVLFVIFLFQGELQARHGLALVAVYAVYLLLLFLITKRRQIQDPGFHSPEPRGKLPLWLRIATLDITHVILHKRSIDATLAWLILLLSTAVMTAGTWLLVWGTEVFGKETEIPLIFIAVVLSAAATSVPDTIISLKDARKGNYDDAVSNALGSNIFDIAFALGLPLFLYTLLGKGGIQLPEEIQNFTKEVWVFLFLATFLSLVIMLVGKYLTRLKASLLLVIYALFILFVGTQVEEGWKEVIGDHLGDFLTFIADGIGALFSRN